jgi:hypothetical protein
VIVLDLTADDRFPPTSPHGQAVHRRIVLGRALQRCNGFEGVPSSTGVCSIRAQARGQYNLDGWVVYGRPHPTAAQKARAQAELDRLVLPRWPRWR